MSTKDYTLIHRLLSEHEAHEDVSGYDPEVYQPSRDPQLTPTRALVLGTLIAFGLYWLGGLIGAVLK